MWFLSLQLSHISIRGHTYQNKCCLPQMEGDMHILFYQWPLLDMIYSSVSNDYSILLLLKRNLGNLLSLHSASYLFAIACMKATFWSGPHVLQCSISNIFTVRGSSWLSRMREQSWEGSINNRATNQAILSAVKTGLVSLGVREGRGRMSECLEYSRKDAMYVAVVQCYMYVAVVQCYMWQ